MKHLMGAIALIAVLATSAGGQGLPKEAPGHPDIAAVQPGSYKVDTGHTQVLWQVAHMGFSKFDGQFGGVTGRMTLDPRRPEGAKLSVSIPISGLTTTVAALNTHLSSHDFFDSAKFPAATFESTSVKVSGKNALITGNLTLHGLTRPVTLDAHFIGAGPGVMAPRVTNVGFEATTAIKRSDFGIGYGIPLVSDEVHLRINAAFEKSE